MKGRLLGIRIGNHSPSSTMHPTAFDFIQPPAANQNSRVQSQTLAEQEGCELQRWNSSAQYTLQFLRRMETMGESKIQRFNRLDLDEVCEMIADGASLAQIGAKFDRSPNVINMAGRVEANSTCGKIDYGW